MLALGIRYLNGFVAAADPAGGEQVEWPPHPGRVFMALAAAHFVTGCDPEEREALLWLESLEAAPAMSVPEAHSRAVVEQYVPVGDDAGDAKALLQSAPLPRKRVARVFARAWLERDTLLFVWPQADPESRVRSALERLCAKVTRIGHSSSMVQMWVEDEEQGPGPNWVPDEERATIRLRVATPGTLADLERRYNEQQVESFASMQITAADPSDKKAATAAKKRLREEFGNEPPPRWRPQLAFSAGYARFLPREEEDRVHGTVFSPHMPLLRLEPVDSPYPYLDLPSVLSLTSRWRDALLSQSNDQSPAVRSMLSGHDTEGRPVEKPHLAFVPLAFVGHEHADGRLLGVGLALPDGTPPDVRQGVLAVVQRTIRLLLGPMGVWQLVSETRESPPWNLRAGTWTAFSSGATHWSTVTPVVYDRHPKEKDKAAYLGEVEAMIRTACRRIGLPEPREVIVTPVSAHLGVPPVHEFPRLCRKDGSERRHSHAILVFGEAVRGPVLLGAGRYRGYGLCRPMEP